MIEIPLVGSLAFLLLIALANALGIGIARRLPFTPAWRVRGVVLAMGVAFGPFLLGLSGLISLALLPGGGHWAHYAATVFLLAVLTVVAWKTGVVLSIPPAEQPNTRDRFAVVLRLLVVAFVVLLLFDATAIPLVQSDALEYALAAKRMYVLRTLSAYPPIDPASDAIGFYGPWTHPPLYVVLIYLATICQGTADVPGLMRMIAPWALLASAMFIFTLAARRSRRAGMLAVLFLIGTPSLFLGADSASIDAMTVLGTTLVIAGVVAFDTTRLAGVASAGAALGLALWTHSQAVLLLPMAIVALCFADLPVPAQTLAKRATVLAATALAFGAGPYVANLLRFGSAVSDTSLVYAIPKLDWPGYFAAVRDVGTASARIQYGILKGWTMLESFALSWWFMLFGAVILLKRGAGRLEKAALAVVACYVAGIIASVLLGMDIMIRNERYYLIVAPAVALVAACGLMSAVEGWGSARPMILRALLAAVALMFAAHLPVLLIYRSGRASLALRDLARPMSEKLSLWEGFGAMTAVASAPDTGLVLTFKPSDLYYARRKMISFLDPRMILAYEEADAAATAAYLQSLGVTRVHVPSYSPPPVYNSPVSEMLADPSLTRLDRSARGHQVYEMASAGAPCETRMVGPDRSGWTWNSGVSFGGSKRVFTAAGSTGVVTPGVPPHDAVVLLQRDRFTTLTSAAIPVGVSRREQLVRVELTGRGFATLSADIRDSSGVLLTREPLGGTLLSSGYSPRTLARRFVTPARAATLKIELEYGGQSAVGVTSATVSSICAT